MHEFWCWDVTTQEKKGWKGWNAGQGEMKRKRKKKTDLISFQKEAETNNYSECNWSISSRTKPTGQTGGDGSHRFKTRSEVTKGGWHNGWQHPLNLLAFSRSHTHTHTCSHNEETLRELVAVDPDWSEVLNQQKPSMNWPVSLSDAFLWIRMCVCVRGFRSVSASINGKTGMWRHAPSTYVSSHLCHL